MDLICRYLNVHLLACTVFISPLWGIYGSSSDKLPSPLDKCSPNPCQNRALCRTRGDSYSCFCVPGFQGSHCQINVNECVSQPCQNGGTCLDGVGRYSCLCSQGFTGVSCEVNVDECQSDPCLNGGRCHDDVGGFWCTCPPGFHGDLCQINIDECQDEPCQNGAQCIDGVNEYRCDCSNTAFKGIHCETPLPACRSEPCFNSAICQDSPGNYSCLCWPGFEGRQCEVDIPECASAPCMHGGRCVERSWQVLYGSEPLLPLNFDPRKAVGFICSCPNGTTGSLCQEVIDQCDPSPCQNGGTCESFVGGYICHCPKHTGGILYGGATCQERLVGCEGHKCQNHASCTPFLLDLTHGYTCSCTPGFTGPLCKTPTSFSFERRGYLLLQSPLVDSEVSVNVTLTFKTVLPRALLFQRNSRGLLLTLSLQAGLLRLALRKDNGELESPSQVLELPHNVSDGQWHSVEATLGNWVLSLKLLDVARSYGAQTYHKVAPVQILAGPLSPPQSTYIGGVLEDADSRSPAFIGCMRDVFVDWQLVVPEEWLSNSAVNVSPGCSHRDRCLDGPCQNGAECVNLWQSYQCYCPRPYEGQDCEEEHVTARFGNEDSHSYAAFTITDNITDAFSISLFLRTRKNNGLLLAVANNNNNNNNNSLYFTMWLEDGRVLFQRHSSGIIKAKSVISDGEVHFVHLEMANGRLTLYVQGEVQGYMDIRRVDIPAGDTVYVGGLSESQETATFGGYLKGCVQDLRINDRRLQFFGLDTSVRSYPLQHLDNVTAGCSGDNKCSRNPCLNGGMCFSVWDDFTCSCPPSTSGRHCEDVRWCELVPCPGDAECRMLSEGYECYSNATFVNDTTVLTYRGNGLISRNITNLSLNIRTRKRNAAILHADNGSSFITLSVQEGHLFLELQSTDEKEENREVFTVSLGSQRTVSDGEWHNVHVFMSAPWMHKSRWTLVLDGEIEEARISKNPAGNLDFLREGVDVFLGGLAPDGGWSLSGCLSTVELGGIALPYFTSSDVNLPRLQKDQFTLTSQNAPLQLGCSGASVCDPNPCLNGAQCQDLFNWFNCSCVGGWAGRRCEVFVDACASDPCRHGNCSTRGLSYECACELGYEGIDCEVEVDVCEDHQCANGGTCLHGARTYSCLCPDNYTGLLCSERIEEIPWYMIVKTVRPKLPVSVCGDNTKNYTCFNGGNCTERELSCDCPPGFTGHRCEQEVDECKSNPCLNGGYCRNLINRFICVCDMSFAGDVCEIDVSDIYFYVALLLWQNLFQLLSYMILRLDDEPEVDWGDD